MKLRQKGGGAGNTAKGTGDGILSIVATPWDGYQVVVLSRRSSVLPVCGRVVIEEFCQGGCR